MTRFVRLGLQGGSLISSSCSGFLRGISCRLRIGRGGGVDIGGVGFRRRPSSFRNPQTTTALLNQYAPQPQPPSCKSFRRGADKGSPGPRAHSPGLSANRPRFSHRLLQDQQRLCWCWLRLGSPGARASVPGFPLGIALIIFGWTSTSSWTAMRSSSPNPIPI